MSLPMHRRAAGSLFRGLMYRGPSLRDAIVVGRRDEDGLTFCAEASRKTQKVTFVTRKAPMPASRAELPRPSILSLDRGSPPICLKLEDGLPGVHPRRSFNSRVSRLSRLLSLNNPHFTAVPVRDLQTKGGSNEASREGAEVRQVSLEHLEGEQQGIVLLTLNRPSARNAIGRDLLSQLLSHIQHLHVAVSPAPDSSTPPPPRVVVVNSGVPGVFSAGADLKERKGMSERQAADFVDSLRNTFTLLERLPIPTIAAVDGLALGGGLELALACDLRVCGTTSELALPETALAIIPGAGGTQRLPRLVGRARAKELVFTGRRVKADEAYRIGLVNSVTAQGEAVTTALQWAQLMLAKGPLALQSAKVAIDRGMELGIEEGLELERESYSRILGTEDRMEGLKAFSQKRTPQFTGR